MNTTAKNPNSIEPEGADTSWMVAPSGMIYALKDKRNHCTINVEMLDGAYHSPAGLDFAHMVARRLKGCDVAETPLAPVGANTGWLISGSLLYALRHGVNHCSIRVGMVDGENNGPKSVAFAQRLLALLTCETAPT